MCGNEILCIYFSVKVNNDKLAFHVCWTTAFVTCGFIIIREECIRVYYENVQGKWTVKPVSTTL